MNEVSWNQFYQWIIRNDVILKKNGKNQSYTDAFENHFGFY